jgi:hypothetical protein
MNEDGTINEYPNGNIMCCTEETHKVRSRRMFDIQEQTLRNGKKFWPIPTKLQYLYYFLGNDMNNWFRNRMFSASSSFGGRKKIIKLKSKKTKTKKKSNSKK